MDNQLPKKRIPAEYKTKYGIKNLFKVELPNLWRMLYTLTAGSPSIVNFGQLIMINNLITCCFSGSRVEF